jgi:ferric-dicitrate binding protein FerR (iron transport regulator)
MKPWSGRAIVLLLMATLVVARAAAAEDVAWVAALDGTAEAQRGGAWTALAQGAAVQLGDHVRTATASRLKLLFRDDSVLTLAERSELVIDEQVAGVAPTSSFSLLLGQVRAVVNDRYSAKGAAFEVKSPTAIAGVRGTSFIAGYDQSRDETQVVGLEHTTAVRSAADPTGTKQVKVGPGQSTTIGRGKMPSLPIKLPASAIRVLTGKTTASAQGKGKQAGAPNTTGEPRAPHQANDRAESPQGRVVDQPIGVIKKGVAPPPPPVR